MLNFNTFFYTFILVIFFFSGFDSSLLYHRTFLEGQVHTVFEYAHFFFSLFAGWFVGFFLIKKIVNQYNVHYIFRVSLLMASISIWIQYKTAHHQPERMFSQLIIDNVMCSIVLGLLSYSLLNLLKMENDIQYLKKQKASIILVFLAIVYSFILNDDNLNSGFLMSSVIYFLSYMFFLFNSVNKLNSDIKTNVVQAFGLITFTIIFCICIVQLRTLEHLVFLSEGATPIFICCGFLLFEATRSGKNKIQFEPKHQITTETILALKKAAIEKNSNTKKD